MRAYSHGAAVRLRAAHLPRSVSAFCSREQERLRKDNSKLKSQLMFEQYHSTSKSSAGKSARKPEVCACPTRHARAVFDPRAPLC